MRKILFFFSIFLCGLVVGSFTQKRSDTIQYSEQIKLLQKIDKDKLSRVQKDLELTLKDRGEVLIPFTIPFSQKVIGVYSPYFEGKKITVNPYRYRAETVLSKKIDIPELGTKHKVSATVWEFGKNASTMLQQAGYSNKSEAVPLQMNMFDPGLAETNLDIYVTQNRNMKFTYLLSVHGREIYEVVLSGYQPIVKGKRLFLYLSTSGEFDTENSSSSEVLQAKEQLKKLADSISYK